MVPVPRAVSIGWQSVPALQQSQTAAAPCTLVSGSSIDNCQADRSLAKSCLQQSAVSVYPAARRRNLLPSTFSPGVKKRFGHNSPKVLIYSLFQRRLGGNIVSLVPEVIDDEPSCLSRGKMQSAQCDADPANTDGTERGVMNEEQTYQQGRSSCALTAEIVSAHVANNTVVQADVPELIQSVFNKLTELAERRGCRPGRADAGGSDQEVGHRRLHHLSRGRQEAEDAQAASDDRLRHDAGGVPGEVGPEARLSDGRAELRRQAAGSWPRRSASAASRARADRGSRPRLRARARGRIDGGARGRRARVPFRFRGPPVDR